jgi:hypothetical protein
MAARRGRVVTLNRVRRVPTDGAAGMVDVRFEPMHEDHIDFWELTAFVSKHPLQLLFVEVLQRPIEFTQYVSIRYSSVRWESR